MENNEETLIIGWLYPELMSTYGDRGNIIVLQKRCQWQGIGVKVRYLDFGFRISDLQKCNLLFMGGAQDRQQKIVMGDLRGKKAEAFTKMVEEGIVGLYICGAYQFLGKYYQPAKGKKIIGLKILDLYTEHPGEEKPRLIGDVVVTLSSTIRRSFDFVQDDNDCIIVGFENHGGRTYLGENVKPLGTVIKGSGNNGGDKTEGAIYKNTFGSYLHGPILPKNPHFADLLIRLALQRKYGQVKLASKVKLEELNDSLEWQAHKTIAKRIGIFI